jgi:hypothetical protein
MMAKRRADYTGNETIFAIDPGNEKSAFVEWDGEQIHRAATVGNSDLINLIYGSISSHGPMAIEMIAGYGMPVGKEVFETVYWIGRFCEAWKERVDRVFRKDVKLHLCGSTRAKDSNIIQALKDRFGDKPTKKNPNPVYGEFKLKKDEWQAFALAVTWWDLNKAEHKTGLSFSGFIPD